MKKKFGSVCGIFYNYIDYVYSGRLLAVNKINELRGKTVIVLENKPVSNLGRNFLNSET